MQIHSKNKLTVNLVLAGAALLGIMLISIGFASKDKTDGVNKEKKHFSGETIEPNQKYDIATDGYNPDIYEFTPVGNSDYTCVLIKSGDSVDGIQCFPKKGNEK